MKKANKIEISKLFIDVHKNQNLEDWSVYDDNDLIDLYDKLIFGEFGEVSFYDDNRAEVSQDIATEAEIEINSTDSKYGHAIIFDWSL